MRTRGPAALLLLTLSQALTACVAITDFGGYRDAPDGGGDASSDAASDAGASDASADADADAAADAGPDSGEVDSGEDSGIAMDSGEDSGIAMDSGMDSGIAMDSGMDSGIAMDSGMDSGIAMDSGTDSGVDSGATCGSGLTLCDGTCVNLDSDLNNCGTCGRVCNFAHASATCSTGMCRVSACHAGYLECGAVGTDCVAAVTRYTDGDGDGYGDPTTGSLRCPTEGVADATDCNDGDRDVHPGATEVCNHIDDNCNMATDEGETLAPQPIRTVIASAERLFFDIAAGPPGMVSGTRDVGYVWSEWIADPTSPHGSTGFLRMDATGSIIGSPVTLDATQGQEPHICFDGAGYIVVDSDGRRIFARRVGATGAALGLPLIVNDSSASNANAPRCAAFELGGIHYAAVVWTSDFSRFFPAPHRHLRYAVVSWSASAPDLTILRSFSDLDSSDTLELREPAVVATDTGFYAAWSASECTWSGTAYLCSTAELRHAPFDVGTAAAPAVMAPGLEAMEVMPRIAYDGSAGTVVIGYASQPTAPGDSTAVFAIRHLGSTAAPTPVSLGTTMNISAAIASRDGGFGLIVEDFTTGVLRHALLRVDATGGGATLTPSSVSFTLRDAILGVATDTPPAGSPASVLVAANVYLGSDSNYSAQVQELRRVPLCP